MKNEEHERQLRSETRPVPRTGTWWVGPFAVTVMMLVLGGCTLALCLGL